MVMEWVKAWSSNDMDRYASYYALDFYSNGMNKKRWVNYKRRLANKYNYIVVGTSDKSELLLGYFTKYGDGGVDILPIGCLYKTQVRALGKYLGIPGRIIAKPSSPRLWPGHLAEEELGFKYEDVDPVLYALFDLKLPIEETVYKTGKSIEFVKKIYEIVQKNEHKRKTPPVPSI